MPSTARGCWVMSLIEAATPVEPDRDRRRWHGLPRRDRKMSQHRVDPVRTHHVHRLPLWHRLPGRPGGVRVWPLMSR